MKLYLSSFKIGKNPKTLVNMLGENLNTAYITNGHAHAATDVRQFESTWDIRELREAWLTPEVLNLSDYFGKQKLLKKKLESFGLIYVAGWHILNLRIAMKLSGFDIVIKELIDSDIVYAWYDSGAGIVGPDLNAYKAVELESCITYKHETIWEWLGLTPWYIVGNINSIHELSNEKSKKLMKYYDEKELKYKKIKDWEVILHAVKK